MPFLGLSLPFLVFSLSFLAFSPPPVCPFTDSPRPAQDDWKELGASGIKAAKIVGQLKKLQ